MSSTPDCETCGEDFLVQGYEEWMLCVLFGWGWDFLSSGFLIFACSEIRCSW